MNIQPIQYTTANQTIKKSLVNQPSFQDHMQRAVQKDSAVNSGVKTNVESRSAISDSFDDEMFAYKIAFREPASIDTSKKINWSAKGEHLLTEEEIDYLKDQYDITNLTPQEFYDLMSDLTNLDAISADEAVSKYCSIEPAPYWGTDTALAMFGSFVEYQQYTSTSCNNIISGLLGSKFFFTGALEHIKTDLFKGQLLFERRPQLLAEFEPRYQAAYEENERMLSIFRQLIRDDSPWEKYIEESEIMLENGFFEKLDTNIDSSVSDTTFLDEIINNPQNNLPSINSILGLRHCKYAEDEWDMSFIDILKKVFTFHEEWWLPLK